MPLFQQTTEIKLLTLQAVFRMGQHASAPLRPSNRKMPFFFLIAYACSQIKAGIPGPWLTGISAITSAITEGHQEPPSLGTKWQGK